MNIYVDVEHKPKISSPSKKFLQAVKGLASHWLTADTACVRCGKRYKYHSVDAADPCYEKM